MHQFVFKQSCPMPSGSMSIRSGRIGCRKPGAREALSSPSLVPNTRLPGCMTTSAYQEMGKNKPPSTECRLMRHLFIWYPKHAALRFCRQFRRKLIIERHRTNDMPRAFGRALPARCRPSNTHGRIPDIRSFGNVARARRTR